MKHGQTELKQRIGKAWDTYRKHMPEVARPYDELAQEAYSAGAVEGKTKRLMALCAALVKGCRGCILYQTDHALTLGATLDEILETCAVAVSLGGTMAAAEAARVVEFLEEKECLS